MVIKSVFDKEFAQYGQVVKGYDFSELIKVLNETVEAPADAVAYWPGLAQLEALPIREQISNHYFGGMPVQIGACTGYCKVLNCLEYHRDSEVNIVANDVVLLVAPQQAIVDGKIHSDAVEAFFAPAGTGVEFYATTLHYAPCNAEKDGKFKVVIVLPKGTNGPIPNIKALNDEDKTLRACNKWLLAHKEATEASEGAYIGLTGENIDIADIL